MKQTIITLATTIVILAFASNGAEAVKRNPSPIGKPPPVSTADRAEAACEKDLKKCMSYVEPLCRRLLRRGFGGGSMRNCEDRKLRRCFSKENKCLTKTGKY